MSKLEKIVLRGGDDPPTFRTRIAEAWRSIWLGPYNTQDRTLAALWGGAPAASGIAVNETNALSYSAFFCAVSTIAWDVASLPLFLFKNLPAGGKSRAENAPINVLVHDRANPEMTAFQFRATVMMNALTTGGGFAEIVRDGSGRPTSLWHLDPARVTSFRTGDGLLRYRVSNSGGGDTVFPPSDILHVRGVSADGLVGLDMIRLCRESLGLAIAAERFGSTYFGNNAQLGGIISVSSHLSEVAAKNLRDSLASRHAGLDRSHRLLLLDSGATYTATASNARDSQLQELRVHQIREIARFYRLPVSYLGDLERATFSNFEQQQLVYFTHCLRPWLVNFETELSMKLIAAPDQASQNIEFVTEGFLRADATARANFYSTMVNAGLMTPNEIRARENLPPIAGGDVAYRPLNMTPLTTASARDRSEGLPVDLRDDELEEGR